MYGAKLLLKSRSFTLGKLISLLYIAYSTDLCTVIILYGRNIVITLLHLLGFITIIKRFRLIHRIRL